MINIQDAWYRVSVKALISNEVGDILLCKESDGTWDLPGGGLDHNEDQFVCLQRELYEEMGLEVTHISRMPECFITHEKKGSESRPWIANICYRVEVKDLDFKRSDECVEIGFFNHQTIQGRDVIGNVPGVFQAIFCRKIEPVKI